MAWKKEKIDVPFFQGVPIEQPEPRYYWINPEAVRWAQRNKKSVWEWLWRNDGEEEETKDTQAPE